MRLREITPGMVICCKTKKEAELLMLHMGYSRVFVDFWDNYEHETCYECGSSCYFATKGYYEKEGRKVVEFSDLIIDEKPAKKLSGIETLQIMTDICKNTKECYKCLLIEKCNRPLDYADNAKYIYDICVQWKAEQERPRDAFDVAGFNNEISKEARKVCEECGIEPSVIIDLLKFIENAKENKNETD